MNDEAWVLKQIYENNKRILEEIETTNAMMKMDIERKIDRDILDTKTQLREEFKINLQDTWEFLHAKIMRLHTAAIKEIQSVQEEIYNHVVEDHY
eukprot:3026632-Rhodomonas_salina.1